MQPFLRERAAGTGGVPQSYAAHWAAKRYQPPGEVEIPNRDRAASGGASRDAARWALPRFSNASCASREFPLARDSADAWGGPHLDAVNLSALVDRPFDELGLDQFFDSAATDDPDADAERRRVASLGAETAPPWVGFLSPSVNTPPPPRPSRD